MNKNCNIFWVFLGVIIVAILISLSGCATSGQTVKPNQSPIPKVTTAIPVAPPVVTQKEVKDVLNFVTFKSEPIGAGVYVIDSQTGKEVGYLGTTPVRILLIKKRVEIEGFRTTCTVFNANAAGLTLSGKTGKVEQIEFQFKFKMPGFYDDIKIEKFLLNTSNDTDTVLSMTLTKVK